MKPVLHSNLFFIESFTWLFIILIFLLTAFLKTQFYIDADPSWLMHAAWRMLHGGNYLQNFFEVDPPMAIYLYLIPAWVARIFHIDLLSSLYIYTYVCEFVGILFCRQMLFKIFRDEDVKIRALLQIVVAVIIIFLPGSQFGQRQHFLIIFTLPYFLLVYLRFTEQPVSRALAAVIGLLAGIGFAIKPFYLFSFIMVEIYWLCSKKTWKFLLRPEIVLIALVFLAYAASLVLFTSDYITKVIPQISPIYYSDTAMSIWRIVLKPITLLLLSTILFCVILCRKLVWYKLVMICLLASAGFWLSYVVQRGDWYNHVLPCMAYLLLTWTLLASACCKQAKGISSNWIALMALLVAIYPLEIAARSIFLSIEYKRISAYQQQIDQVKKLAQGKAIYFFTPFITLSGVYPLVDYAHVCSVSRFPSLWMSKPLYGREISGKYPATNLDKERHFFQEAVIEDLLQGQPYLILVEESKSAAFMASNYVLKPTDFIKILLQDKRFKTFWENYTQVANVGSVAFYVKKHN